MVLYRVHIVKLLLELSYSLWPFKDTFLFLHPHAVELSLRSPHKWRLETSLSTLSDLYRHFVFPQLEYH